MVADLNTKISLLVFCTVEAGLDAISEVLRQGFEVSGIIGVDPECVNLENISGYCDVKVYAESRGIDYAYVDSYSLHNFDQNILLQNLVLI